MAKSKFVYQFGGGVAETSVTSKDILGGKGAGLMEMTKIGLPVPAGFTIGIPACEEYYKAKRKLPKEIVDEVKVALAKLEKAVGKKLGDSKDPATRIRPLGRCALDARHARDNPQPRPQRPVGRGARGEDRQSPLRLRQLPPLHPDVLHHRHGPLQGADGGDALPYEEIARPQERYRALRRQPQEALRGVQGLLQAEEGPKLPAGPRRAALGSHRRGLRFLGGRQVRHLPPRREDHRPQGHGSQRRADGVRQQGRHLRHRRLLHPRPQLRRERLLRRLPHQRAGRGCRRRHPHPPQAHRAREEASQGLQAADPGQKDAREELQGDAGPRVHH